MGSVRLAHDAIPHQLWPSCGRSRYENTEALLVGLQLLRVEDVGQKEKRERKRSANATPYARPSASEPAADDLLPGRKQAGYKPLSVQLGSYEPRFAENELGTMFPRSRGLGKHRTDAVVLSRLLLANIPDRAPTEDAPFALRFPMLSRLRLLLNNETLCRDAQMVINAIGLDGPLRKPEAMQLIWSSFSPPASRKGYFDHVMELLVLLYRTKELFSPLYGDPTNQLRFLTWHRQPPPSWSGRDDTLHTFEYVWFHRLSAHLYVRLLREFSSSYMTDRYPETVRHVQETVLRSVQASDWRLPPSPPT